MDDVEHKELILDTIDQLRKRKARPDIERICHMLERKHGLSASVVSSALEKLVQAAVVMKVEYKGSTSYRNAAKWRKTNVGGHLLNTSETSKFIFHAISVLQDNEHTDGEQARGVSLQDIEKYCKCVDNEKLDTEANRNQLVFALKREVDAGNLKILQNGRYTLANYEVKNEQTKGKVKQDKPPAKKGRPPGSLNKAKLNKVTKRKRSRKSNEDTGNPVAQDDDGRCDYCLWTAEKNANGEPEALLVCKDCSAKAHPSCMHYSPELALRSRMSPWQCFDCKTCNVCSDSGNADSMLFCDACDKGYHMQCHTPPVSKKPTGKWVCMKCKNDGISDPQDSSATTEMSASEGEESHKSLDGTLCLPTPCESPVNEQPTTNACSSEFESIKLHEAFQKSTAGEKSCSNEIPDASKWTINDVVNYFISVGFTEQSHSFREQEIDGKSLLLMKRSDVLTGLNLKLGPALKIYNHVRRLQTREHDSSDFTTYL